MKKLQTLGMIGQGFVGTAVMTELSKTFQIIAYDKDSTKSLITGPNMKDSADPPTIVNIASIVENCEVIFICVPTPMFEDGECDIRIVESVIDDIAKEAEFQNKNVITIIKSTVPPGTTEKLNGLSNKVGVAFSPEFLTEANSITDFANQTRVILGIDYLEHIEQIREIFELGLPRANIIVVNSKEAEMTKYTTNLFLATKVSFFNDIYSICEKLNINYNDVIEATMHDPRIGKSHYNVPGPDGDRGFGGTCLPKDINSILHIAQKLGLGLPTITGAQVTNMIVRRNKDWEQMEGRAVTTREAYPANIEGSPEFNEANKNTIT